MTDCHEGTADGIILARMAGSLETWIEEAAAALKAGGAREVYVFGSAARGKIRENSDVDLAVSDLPPEVFFRAMGKASRVLGRPVDLIDLDEDNLLRDTLKKKMSSGAWDKLRKQDGTRIAIPRAGAMSL